ncbi:MAG: bifunctional class I SAM-dependent methyltransferase/glycosyltransferase family 2 protein [Verrucomicrobiae bacterium]|nr:bifunctional class I SAM-dependent methyltransferase/glycosyltransferase family 2 protein [Verrucomicrobiae bacterium]
MNPFYSQNRLDAVRAHFEGPGATPTAASRAYRRVLAHYYRNLIPPEASILEIGCGQGDLLALLPNTDITGVDLSPTQIAAARQRLPHGRFEVQAGETLRLDRTFDVLILSETLNFSADVQVLLETIRSVSSPRTRLILNFHNTLWRPVLAVAELMGLTPASPQGNWLSRADAHNLLVLAGWETVSCQPRLLSPFPLLGLGTGINRFLAPFFPWACLTILMVARPKPDTKGEGFSVSVIIPARNEAGNMAGMPDRIPTMGRSTELIFVEGHSRDDTWEQIQLLVNKHPDRTIIALRQSGTGKGNAVREGFDRATGDILMILDADLTVPPEELPKFYNVLASGQAEFANGVRLVYPMEKQAMRFLNMCANKFFSLAFSWVLGQPLKDTLCGTKVLFRKDYEAIARNRSFFGDFDPFGDFDLLFGACRLNLKITDIPIRYRERTYGTTNIQRWRHGWLLLKMLVLAARKLKFV